MTKKLKKMKKGWKMTFSTKRKLTSDAFQQKECKLSVHRIQEGQIRSFLKNGVTFTVADEMRVGIAKYAKVNIIWMSNIRKITRFAGFLSFCEGSHNTLHGANAMLSQRTLYFRALATNLATKCESDKPKVTDAKVLDSQFLARGNRIRSTSLSFAFKL